MCTEMPSRIVQVISMPGTNATPSATAVSPASRQPAVVSWSVSAKTSTPASWAERATSPGVWVPSEAMEWVCRSIFTRATIPAGSHTPGGDPRGTMDRDRHRHGREDPRHEGERAPPRTQGPRTQHRLRPRERGRRAAHGGARGQPVAAPRQRAVPRVHGLRLGGPGAHEHTALRGRRVRRRAPCPALAPVPGRASRDPGRCPQGACERHRLPLPAALRVRPPHGHGRGPRARGRAGHGAHGRGFRRRPLGPRGHPVLPPDGRPGPSPSSTRTPRTASSGWARAPRSNSCATSSHCPRKTSPGWRRP